MVDVFVMPAMLGTPHERGVLEGPGAEEEGEEADRPMRLEGEMREKPVIPEGDAEAGEREHHAEERDLEPVEAVMPDVSGGGGEGEKERPDQEAAGDPVDAVKGYSEIHGTG